MVELQGAVLPAEDCTVPRVPTSHRRHHYTTGMLIASKECDSFTYRPSSLDLPTSFTSIP